METKSVVKSRSSNSAKTTQNIHVSPSSEHRNKKCRSSAEFQPSVTKKRGVYVEPAKLSTNVLEKNQSQEKPKAPPRPGPGNKKFLASVLTILAELPKKNYNRRLSICDRADNEDKNNVDNEKVKTKRRLKYKSKVLNDVVNRAPDQFVVLKSQKDIIHTPSIVSGNESENLEAAEKRKEEAGNVLRREIIEGQKSRKDKRVRIDEPKTLVDDTKPQKIDEATGEANGKLFNFFVDLLETTISVYNFKQEFNKSPPISSDTSSTKCLEINESVAKKLNEPVCEKTEKSDASPQPSNHFICLKDLEFNNRNGIEHEKANSIKGRRKKIKAESFSYFRTPAVKKLKTESVIQTKKSLSKRDKKKKLLNMFKEQLRMDCVEFEEPQNLYQALKVLANNKRRCRFEEHSKKSQREYVFPECMFKRRKIMSTSLKSSQRKRAPVSSRDSETTAFKPSSIYTADKVIDSDYSLDVQSYDYETS